LFVGIVLCSTKIDLKVMIRSDAVIENGVSDSFHVVYILTF
jgi:hypothetical protein